MLTAKAPHVPSDTDRKEEHLKMSPLTWWCLLNVAGEYLNNRHEENQYSNLVVMIWEYRKHVIGKYVIGNIVI